VPTFPVQSKDCFDTAGWASGPGEIICLDQDAKHMHKIHLMPLPPRHLLLY